MKTIILIGIMLLTPLFSVLTPKQTETRIPLCHATPNDMAFMAADPAFQRLHVNPLPFTYRGAGEMIKFATPDGQMASGFLLKSKTPSDKWLLVYQEWWGLNDNVKQQAEKFYDDLRDVNVLALDMYDGQVATQPAEAGKLMQECL